jgi:hypothetical protein
LDWVFANSHGSVWCHSFFMQIVIFNVYISKPKTHSRSITDQNAMAACFFLRKSCNSLRLPFGYAVIGHFHGSYCHTHTDSSVSQLKKNALNSW